MGNDYIDTFFEVSHCCNTILCPFCSNIDICVNVDILYFVDRFILRMKSVVQKRHLISYPAIPKIDKALLLECALPPRTLQEKKTNPKFTVMSRSGRYLRTIYGASILVCLLHFGHPITYRYYAMSYCVPRNRRHISSLFFRTAIPVNGKMIRRNILNGIEEKLH